MCRPEISWELTKQKIKEQRRATPEYRVRSGSAEEELTPTPTPTLSRSLSLSISRRSLRVWRPWRAFCISRWDFRGGFSCEHPLRHMTPGLHVYIIRSKEHGLRTMDYRVGYIYSLSPLRCNYIPCGILACCMQCGGHFNGVAFKALLGAPDSPVDSLYECHFYNPCFND